MIITEVDDLFYEDDSVNGAEEINGDISKQMNLDDETDIKGVSDTVFDDKADSLGMNILRICEVNSGLDSSIPFPPRFTPEREFQHVDAQEVQGMENSLSNRRSEVRSRVLEDAQPLNEHASPSIDSKKKAGGSILEVIDDMIKVGQSMGFTMEGCMNDMEKIIGSQGAHGGEFPFCSRKQVGLISVMMLKCYGPVTISSRYTISEAVGNSGGILCVWDPSVFRKEHHVVSDNFVALYGSWVSNQAKLLVVSIYAPQSITSKRSLWSYISSLISRWDGYCMVMGDFNEVRLHGRIVGSVYNGQVDMLEMSDLQVEVRNAVVGLVER
ncbi:RNA-directed DNA polymerase, eukaryota [Tanacetum coccineum]